MDLREVSSRLRVEVDMLHAWAQAGWLTPQQESRTPHFSEIDIARVQLIRDLKQDLGVNDEGIPIILDLVDQLHGLRRALGGLLATIAAQPEVKRQFLSGMHDGHSRGTHP
jgi:chaperone modulatory protein CbpM